MIGKHWVIEGNTDQNRNEYVKKKGDTIVPE